MPMREVWHPAWVCVIVIFLLQIAIQKTFLPPMHLPHQMAKNVSYCTSTGIFVAESPHEQQIAILRTELKNIRISIY
jgi:hypothetical protein